MQVQVETFPLLGCNTADVQDFPLQAELYFPAWGPEGLCQRPFPEKCTASEYLPASSALNSACLAQATFGVQQPHVNIGASLEKADVAEAELVCELDSKRETSHLAQCGKSLSSNQLQAKQLLMFF